MRSPPGLISLPPTPQKPNQHWIFSFGAPGLKNLELRWRWQHELSFRTLHPPLRTPDQMQNIVIIKLLSCSGVSYAGCWIRCERAIIKSRAKI
jgi:hypothetical protein